MDLLPTLPRRSWSERTSLILACFLIALGGASIIGWFSNNLFLLQPFAGIPPIKINGAVSIFLIGGALLGLELGLKQLRWLPVVPAVVSLATLLEYAFKVDWQIDEILIRDQFLINTVYPGRMSSITACSLLLVSLALIWRAAKWGARPRLFAKAIIGSLASSVGFSTILGYVASLPAAYMWGSATATGPVAAISILLAGLALLVLAWREAIKSEGGPPAWSAMPAVIACLTLTLILWIGLRERELVYLGAKTQTAMDSLAVQVNFELDQQANDIEKIGRRWGDTDQNSPVIWEADAHSLMASSRIYGCEAISYVDPNLKTIWVYPTEGNEASFAFDHSTSPARASAIAATQTNRNGTAAIGTAAISSTTQIGGQGDGVVIYAPVSRHGELIGFVAAEYLYSKLLRSIVAERAKITDDYYATIRIGGVPIFDSYPLAGRDDTLTLDKSYTIFDRRMSLSLTPSKEALARDRRYLPELALLAGFGITLLLGLSVHLARVARTGQREAELSNQKLLAENEERRRIEARLKVSDERLRLALDSTQIGIFEWNVSAHHVYYSDGLWAMLGYEHSKMPATVEAWQSLIHPDDLESYQRRIESQLNGVAAFIEPEYRARSKSGDWRWVHTRSKTVATSRGRPTRIIGTVQDITARREAEQALRESQAEARKLSLVASKTDNPVLIASPDGSIEWVNESFIRVMEYSLEEVIGRNPVEFMVGPETNPRSVLQVRGAMARGRGCATHVVNYSKSGRKYHLHLEIQPIYGEPDHLDNFIAILTDITVRVETENQLRRAKTEADAASRAKSEFLASMSHEIRTPMNGVIGMTSLLMGTPLSGEQRDFVNTIRTSGEALLTIINDILDFSKIESGKLKLEAMPFELALCLEEAFDLFALQASAKKLEITYHIETDVPSWILGDVTRLRQIVVNLVNNAVKFTPSGSIAVIVSNQSASSAGPQVLEFAVKDTGIGIPPDRLSRLFKAFSQVDSSTTRKYGGTGLGLAISQRLSILMGGEIRVESVPGEGSSFIFTIVASAAITPADSALPPPPESLTEGTMLCVEPHPVTRAHLQNIFDLWKVPCTFTETPEEALIVAAELPAPPTLLIINGDETLPVSPLETLSPIKVPRLLMLPFGQSSPTELKDKLPFGTVFKPLKTATLLHAITQLFDPLANRRQADAYQVGRRLLAEEFPLDVLIVEDNAVNQKVALRFLERLGYRADAVGNGIEAVTTLQSRHYHLVLMDLQMPEMDGFEASRQIRELLPPDRQPKIVALTANAMQGDRELCLEAGMDDYISKPVKLHEIGAAIRRQFGETGTRSAMNSADSGESAAT